ncbi:HEAT repeat domain-containing protein [Paenibacillus sp. MER 180]|uniref:HEAT repeat domain-containing protein n=1 Tax=Paenibacillus sp. MER 180 TaxID=2939570 RepID=UPI00203F3078|nr:HEAT repeat domain-containing protein [Paenibacillus sp. MER 180]MCM3294257.1 HEAT repeat domain-containing protein [Paenibacillus sp. MER 180]
MYQAYNENNVRVVITDEQLSKAFRQHGKDLPIEIVIAMGASRNKMFIPRLNEALYHQTLRVRIEAIHSLLSIQDIQSLSSLQEKEKSISEEDFNATISEKAVLQSAIIRLVNGPKGAEEAFFEGDYHPRVKLNLLYNYSSNMILLSEDVEFIINALGSFLFKDREWIQKLKRDDYEDVIICALEALWNASEKRLLSLFNIEYYQKLIAIGKQILNIKIDSYAKEIVAIFAKDLPPKYAYEMLEPIMNGKAKGDIAKELTHTLSFLHQKEKEA